MNRNRSKRVLSLFLTVLMAVSILPMTALAEGEPGGEPAAGEQLVQPIEEDQTSAPEEPEIPQPTEEQIQEEELQPPLLSFESEGDKFQIGTTAYNDVTTFGSYWYGLREPATVVLLADIDLSVVSPESPYINVEGDQNITLDLNGHTLSAPDPYAPIVMAGGTLTITDTSPGNSGSVSGINTEYGGTLKITGGNYPFNPTAYVDSSKYIVTGSGTYTVVPKYQPINGAALPAGVESLTTSALETETDCTYPWKCYNGNSGVLCSGNSNIDGSVSTLKVTVRGSGALVYKYKGNTAQKRMRIRLRNSNVI